ncbi:MAG: hypothetical protein ACRDJC_15155, partial [Thermomicrobiales bacterium]
MTNSRFDIWTRRRFGLAMGGIVASALSLPLGGGAKARKKKKKRKKRCLRVNQPCRDGSKKKRCCKNLRCDEAKIISPTGLGCCRHFQARCESEIECCSSFKCQNVVGLPGNRCCTPLGTFCYELGDCCAAPGVRCDDNTCCRDAQAACQSEHECCGELQCGNVPQLGGLHCCAGDGGGCEVGNDCCNELNCIDGA